MNYKAELRGFSFDRALHYHEKLANKADLSAVKATADDLVEYFYMAEKDFADAGQYVIGLADSIDLDALAELVNALENIHERRTAHAERIANKVQKSLESAVTQ